MVKVLIADDEYIMRQGLKYMIRWEQEGYQIVGEATNGKEALQKVEEEKPHIVICDIVMPMLDGVDFAGVMHKMYPQIPIIILSGYDKFDYVKKTFQNGVADYILKPTLTPELLLAALKKAVNLLPNHALIEEKPELVSLNSALERLLSGTDKTLSPEVKERLEAQSYAIYAGNIRKTNQNGQDITNILDSKLLGECEKLPCAFAVRALLREETAVVLIGYKESSGNNQRQNIKQLHQNLQMLYEPFFAVYSRNFSDLNELMTVYGQDVFSYVDQSFYYQDCTLLFVGDLKKNAKKTQPEAEEKFAFAKYSDLLNAKQYDKAQVMLKEYSDKALKGKYGASRLKNQMKNMLYLYLDNVVLSDDRREEWRKEFFYRVESAQYESDYRRVTENIWETLAVLTEENEKNTDENLQKILDYIDTHYQEDLKLKDVADRFGFNYYYLSANFHQQTGESFSDYLTRIRIEKAVALLRDTSLSIAQISEMVGYSEQGYFSRVFKKVKGKTPSQYQRDARIHSLADLK